ncbi:hypothetical protein LCGC14_2186410 [marine sediment metagenome]|uniref:Uncharacterized protein n=1 Tax=marine sediment metagenome TaxID=412755 RepID=A0A0F9FY99_9ZZZZ
MNDRKEPTPPPAGSVKPPPPAPPAENTAVATIPKQSIEQIMLQRVEPSSIMKAYQAANEVQRARIAAEASGEIAKISWGEKLPQDVRFQVARWCLAHRVDPQRHITILGNRIYDNAEYYIDRCAETGMVERAERIIMAPLDHRTFNVDMVGEKNAKDLLALQYAVNTARLELQVRYGLPDDINEFPDKTAAVLIRLHLRDGRTFEGWNMAGSRGRKKQSRHGPGGDYDPVGDQEPVKTATTRAWRKAAKDFIPFAAETFAEEGVGLEHIEQRLADERERTKALEAQGITNTMGDRLPLESLAMIDEGYPGSTKPEGPVEGLKEITTPFDLVETDEAILEEDAQLALE